MDSNSRDIHGTFRRRLGFDDNPMRRRSDRIQAWARLTAAVLFLVICLGGIVAGMAAYHSDLAAEEADRKYGYRVTGRVLSTSAAVASHDGVNGPKFARVAWRDREARRHVQSLSVIRSVEANQRIRLWIDNRGAATTSPPRHEKTVALGMFMGIGTALFAAFLLAAAYGVFSYVLDRSRAARWDSGWRAVEPRWRREVL